MTVVKTSYRIRIIVRIVLIQSIGFTGLIVALLTPYWLVSCWLGLVVVIMTAELIRYHERSKLVLRNFLHSINQEDFSSLSTIDEKDGELQDAYQQILGKFRELRIEKEGHYHYLQQVIDHVDSALICFDSGNRIELINRSAKELLKVRDIRDLRALEKIDKDLFELSRKIRSGQRDMIRLVLDGKILDLSVRATEFTIEKIHYKMVSFHDIKPELDEQEIDSWQKLVRVLTHEIMNSTIPITNLVAFAREFLTDKAGKPREIPGLNREEINDLVESLSTAESRSKGLVNFVKTTRSLTRIPDPSITDISVKDLFTRISELFKRELEQTDIEMRTDPVRSGMVLRADLELIEQVLINLVRNAMEALKDRPEPKIEMTAEGNDGTVDTISVRDNGPGIPAETLDQIFVPFFTTRKDGSGIGLSLSRQIMKLHKGRIEVETGADKGTCFTLTF